MEFVGENKTPPVIAYGDASPLSGGTRTLEEHTNVSNYNIVERIKILVNECWIHRSVVIV